jgi:hypothetical protein
MGQPADRSGAAEGNPSRAATLRIKRGAKTLSEVPLGRAKLFIGGGKTSQLRLKNAGLADQCVLLDTTVTPFALESKLGPDEVFVNGWAVRKTTVRPGDRVEFGGIVLEICDASGNFPVAAQPQPSQAGAPRSKPLEGATERDLPAARARASAEPSAPPPRSRSSALDAGTERELGAAKSKVLQSGTERDLDPYMGKKTAARARIEDIEQVAQKLKAERESASFPQAPAAPVRTRGNVANPPTERDIPVARSVPAPAQPVVPQPTSPRRGMPVGAVEEISLIDVGMPRTGFSRPPWLEFVGEGPTAQARLYLLHNGAIAGRQGELKVQHASVSKKHSKFDVREGKLFVEDLGSTNGTWVNRVRIQSQQLEDGDTVHLGAVEFKIRIPDAAKKELGNLAPASGERAQAQPPRAFGRGVDPNPTSAFPPAQAGPPQVASARSAAVPLGPNTQFDGSRSGRDDSLASQLGFEEEESVPQPAKPPRVRVPGLQTFTAEGPRDSMVDEPPLVAGTHTDEAPARSSRRDQGTEFDLPRARGGDRPTEPAGRRPLPPIPPSRGEKPRGKPVSGLFEIEGEELEEMSVGGSLESDTPVPSESPSREYPRGDRAPMATRVQFPVDAPTLDKVRDRPNRLPVDQIRGPRRFSLSLVATIAGLLLFLGAVGGGLYSSWPKIQDKLHTLTASNDATPFPITTPSRGDVATPAPTATALADRGHPGKNNGKDPKGTHNVAMLDPTPALPVVTPNVATPVPTASGHLSEDDLWGINKPTPKPTLRPGQQIFGDDVIDLKNETHDVDVAMANLEPDRTNKGLRSERTIGAGELKSIYLDDGAAVLRKAHDDGFELAPSAADDQDDRAQGAKQVDPNKVNMLIRSHFDDVKKCLVGAHFSGGKARVVIEFTIMPDGKPQNAHIISSDVSGSSFNACVTGAVKRIQFPKPKSQSVVVQFPFVFFYN